jgi:general secretion pathway protein A
VSRSVVPEPGRELQPLPQPRWAVKARAEVIESPPLVAPSPLRLAGQTRSFASVLGTVRHGLQQGDRLIVVTGDSGTGKTLLCRALMEEFAPLTRISVMLQPPATPEDLLAQFLRDVGVLDNGTSALLMSRHHLVFALQRFLESLIPLRARAVMVLDEAQHLTPMVLEQLRLALNFETGDAALLQVVLVGQPELDTLLRWPELKRVSQRVSRRCELGGLEPDELPTYIEECLDRRSPGGLVQLTPAAQRSLAALSNGVPRLVDRLCVHALELAASENARRIEPRMVKTAAKRLGIEVPGHRISPRTAYTGAAAMAACAVLAAGVWGWTNRAAVKAAPAGVAVSSAAVAGAASAAPVMTKPIETASGLTVTVASFRTESRARAVVARLVDEGFPAFARSQSEQGPFQVIVGPYVSAEEATAAQRSLAAQGVAGTEVRIETSDLSQAAWR